MTSATVLYCNNPDSARNHTFAMMIMSIFVVLLSAVLLMIDLMTKQFNQKVIVNVLLALVVFALSSTNLALASVIEAKDVSKNSNPASNQKYRCVNVHAIKTHNDLIIAFSSVAMVMMIFNTAYSSDKFKLANARQVYRILLGFMIVYGLVMVLLGVFSLREFKTVN